MTLDELRQLAVNVGFSGQAVNVAAAVAMAESRGNPAAVGDEGTSFGLWQIHTPAHPEYSPGELLDPTRNAQAALAISSGGSNWAPWSTFNSGAYLRYLSNAPAPAPAIPWWQAAIALALGAAGAYAAVRYARRRRRSFRMRTA